MTDDLIELEIANSAAEVVDAARLLKNGFSFQTGANGISLAIVRFIQQTMHRRSVRGSFASGGITGQMVEMLAEGVFDSLFDVECLDLRAVKSYRDNRAHRAMSASIHANPSTRGTVVDKLDTVILGAAEVDLQFNVKSEDGTSP
jgi:citrate lyase subunit alpha/citrate CoA-transferase